MFFRSHFNVQPIILWAWNLTFTCVELGQRSVAVLCKNPKTVDLNSFVSQVTSSNNYYYKFNVFVF